MDVLLRKNFKVTNNVFKRNWIDQGYKAAAAKG